MSEKAGFCTICNRSVYLTSEGGCVFGHGPEAIKGEPHPVQWEPGDAMGNCIPGFDDREAELKEAAEQQLAEDGSDK